MGPRKVADFQLIYLFYFPCKNGNNNFQVLYMSKLELEVVAKDF